MQNISKTFPGVKALDRVNLDVQKGEIHAVVGENGAGKSTLMKVLSGVYPHGQYDGEIVFEGEPARFSGISDSEKQGIIIIHQELALVPQLSIAENIFLGNECASKGVIDWRKTNQRTEELLAKVGLSEAPTTKVDSIGVGKQQLVEIAKALSKDVKLLILDEPTAALQENDSRKLLDLMLELKAQGVTSIIISHKLNEVRYVADSVTVIRDGMTVSNLDAKAGLSEDDIVRDMVGRDMTHRFPEHSRTPGDVLMEVTDCRDHIYHRSWMKNQGLPDDLFDGRPVIGICNTWSQLTPCNAHLRDLAERVKHGIYEAGGFPVEFPVFSTGESTLRPTAMMFRNLASMDVEEAIRGTPLDGVVLLVGCDKTTPSLLMGAASVDIPAIVVTGGPMLNGWFQGERVGSGTHLWKFSEAVKAGEMTQEEFLEAEAAMSRSPGSCNTMGTASTMASMAEALGMALSGNAAIPATI
eukprot:g20754.t1